MRRFVLSAVICAGSCRLCRRWGPQRRPTQADTGQPGAECGAEGATSEPHGFATGGFSNAESHYAGSPETPSAEHGNPTRGIAVRRGLLPGDQQPPQRLTGGSTDWAAIGLGPSPASTSSAQSPSHPQRRLERPAHPPPRAGRDGLQLAGQAVALFGQAVALRSDPGELALPHRLALVGFDERECYPRAAAAEQANAISPRSRASSAGSRMRARNPAFWATRSGQLCSRSQALKNSTVGAITISLCAPPRHHPPPEIPVAGPLEVGRPAAGGKRRAGLMAHRA